MYKVLHLPSKQEIIILDSRWQQQVGYLRDLDKRDALVCPGCQQPVRVRAGKVKRWHFAHKHLQNCPFERESPALLKARAVLYKWLVDQFSAEFVTLEKILEGLKLPRHVDCWVEKDDQTFAYWIFDRRLPPEERNHLKSGFREIGVQVNWVFVADLLRVNQDVMQDRLHLTTTERCFMQESEFDQAWQTHFENLGKSLHYLDADQETLTTYRNLSVIHMPQLHAGARLENPLAQAMVSFTTGEFLHPGEIDRLQKRRREIEAQADAAAKRLQKAQDFFRGGQARKTPLSVARKAFANQPYERLATCKFCGKETADWITYFGQTKECVCRDCKDRVQDRD
jgi:hypothetical protein